MKTWSVFALVMFLAVGCRSSGDEAGTPDGGDDASNVDASSATINQVQLGEIAAGSTVTLSGVIVTAVDSFAAGGTGDFFVQDPAGGAYSGVLVHGAALPADALVPGDIVTIEAGVVAEFAFMADMSGETNTQIVGGTVAKTGTGAAPEPVVLSPWDLTLVGGRAVPTEAEKWEGVLVRFNNVAVTSTARMVGMDATFLEYKITGPLRMDSGMTDLASVAIGDCFQSVTGVFDYAFNFKVVPRSAADLIAGTGCVYEGGAAGDDGALCSNQIDDDHDGFTDCDDLACQKALGDACFTPTTIAAVQMGSDAMTTLPGAHVRLQGVVVTAVGTNLVWVQDAAQGAAWNGIPMFHPTVVGGGTLAVGDVVDVNGTLDEYFDASQLSFTQVTKQAVASQTPLPLVVADPATLVSAATAEQYEGVLVRVNNVTATAAPNQYGEWTVTGGLTCDDILTATIDDGVTANTVFTSITGILHYDHSKYRLLPRSAADVVKP